MIIACAFCSCHVYEQNSTNIYQSVWLARFKYFEQTITHFNGITHWLTFTFYRSWLCEWVGGLNLKMIISVLFVFIFELTNFVQYNIIYFPLAYEEYRRLQRSHHRKKNTWLWSLVMYLISLISQSNSYYHSRHLDYSNKIADMFWLVLSSF